MATSDRDATRATQARAPRRPGRRTLVSFVAAALGVVAAASCGNDGTCIRYSDCPSTLTCAEGRCVVPGHTDDGADAAAFDASTADAFESDTGTVEDDASVPADTTGDDAATDPVDPGDAGEDV